jgi:glutathione S-transferase
MVQHLPALVTLLTMLLLFGCMVAVGLARTRYGVEAPAISGEPGFERAWRVQMNTLENTVMFLPALWLATHYGFPLWAGVIGLVWLLGRAWYALSYLKDARRRGPGFMLSMLAWAALMALAAWGIGRAMLLPG